MKNKITLTTPADITSIVPNKYPSKIVLETGEENVFIPDENKFIVTKDFLSNAPKLFAFCVFTELDMSNFDFSEITTMESWFRGCTNLIKISFPKTANCNKLTELYYCFANTQLKIIDLSFMKLNNNQLDIRLAFFFSSAKKIILPNCSISFMDECFSWCEQLEEIIAPITFDLPDNDSLFETFEQCKKLKLIDLSEGNIGKNNLIVELNNQLTRNNMLEDCIVVLP